MSGVEKKHTALCTIMGQPDPTHLGAREGHDPLMELRRSTTDVQPI